MLEIKHIKNHFLTNPDWREVFMRFNPDWKSETYNPKNYIVDAEKILNANGYSLKIEKRLSNNPKSSWYHAGEMALYHKDEFIFSIETHLDNAKEQVLIEAITKYEIDFTTFK